MKNKLKFLMVLGAVLSCLIILPQVSQAATTWTQSNTDGFGTDENYNGNASAVFDGQLYVGTENRKTGAEIWRTSDGTNWNVSMVDGIGDGHNESISAMVVFNNDLYVGTINGTYGTKIYRTSDGNTYSHINTDGFGDRYNTDAISMSVFDGQLYVGVKNIISGVEIWRSDAGNHWSQVNVDGFGDRYNTSVSSEVFQNHLYMSTYNGITGTEIWRTSDGTNWSSVSTGGFGDGRNNKHSYAMAVYDGWLYAGTWNSHTGTEIWRSKDGTNWSQANADNFGEDWNASKSVSIFSMAVYGNRLYVGGQNVGGGARVWSTGNGTSWTQANTDGFDGSTDNYSPSAFSVFKERMYATVKNDVTGIEMWRLSDITAPTFSAQNPADGATDLTRITNIYFETSDADIGVDLGSLNVTVDGVSAISAGTCQTGYTCTITTQGLGYHVTINPDASFAESTSVAVVANVSDSASNAAQSSWSFTTGTHSTPQPGTPSDTGGVITDRTHPDGHTHPDGTTHPDGHVDGHTIYFDHHPKIITASGPGEESRLQIYDHDQTDDRSALLSSDVTGLFPSSYLGGAGVVAIDQSNNHVLDQFVIFARENGGPQARVMSLESDGTLTSKGQQFLFQASGDATTTSSIRDGLSVTVGDFDDDGFQDDVAACLTGDYAPQVKVFKDATGVDNWELINQFDAPFGAVGCNLGTFQYDDGATELLVTPNHGPADPIVYIYTVGGTLKQQFQAYDDPIQEGLTASSIGERIYTTPNNGSSHVRAFDRAGDAKNSWWIFDQTDASGNHVVKGDFISVDGDIDLDGTDELITAPIGSNGPHVRAFEPSGILKDKPDFFAFKDETLRNGAGIAVLENWHGAN